MPKVPKFEWEDALDPESEEYSPTEDELKEDHQAMSLISQEIEYIDDQIERPGVDPYTGEKNIFSVEDPDETWRRLLYLREDVLSKIKDPENASAAEEGISKTEQIVYRQYIPFIESKLHLFAWQNSPLEKNKPRHQIDSREIGIYFGQARSIVGQFELSEEEEIEFTSELDRLEEKFERYQKEPTLYTFEEAEEKLQQEISEIAVNKLFTERTLQSAGALGNEADMAGNLQELEKLLEKAQTLKDIAAGMSDGEIGNSCRARAQSLYSFAERFKVEFESSPELLRMQGQLRDLLQRIKAEETVQKEELDDIEGRLSGIRAGNASADSQEMADRLGRLFETVGKAFKGEPYDEQEERFDIGTEQIDWAWSILGVERYVSDGDIKRAYKKLAIKYHPDRNKSEDTKRKMQQINEAYEFLKKLKGFK